MKQKKEVENKNNYFILKFVLLLGLFLFSVNFVLANPEGPGTVDPISNETFAGSETGTMVNISGGYIATLNISAVFQNPRWKAFIGWVTGEFSLRDAGGSVIYDWTTVVSSGQVYATRNSSVINWGSIGCATPANMEAENTELDLTNSWDNITATFSGSTHDPFWVGSTNILANTCPSLNTFVNNESQTDFFEEVVLFDGVSIVYAAILEDMATGYDGDGYDFQMLVPEVGTPGFSGATAYYIYVEVS